MSGGILPFTVGGNLATKIKLEPSSSICAATFPLRPLMIEDIPMTVATPITTPNTVKKERNLFLRRESSASRTISLMTQCRDRLHVCSPGCRVDTEEQADGRGDEQTESDGPPFDRCRQGCEP